MQRKSLFTGLLGITSLCGLVSSLKNIYVPEHKTWFEAQQYCRKKYTDLAFINNNEAALRFNILNSGYAWIGLYRDQDHTHTNTDTHVHNDDDDWKWSGGHGHLPYHIWHDGEPNNFGDIENCAAVRSGKGFDAPCNWKLHFFCYDAELVLVKENKTWEEALEHCRGQHGDLPSLRYVLVHHLAQSMILEAQTSQVWTGLCFLAGEWLWVNGQELEYHGWSEEELPLCPALDLRCGVKGGERWGTWDCLERLNFLCFKSFTLIQNHRYFDPFLSSYCSIDHCHYRR